MKTYTLQEAAVRSRMLITLISTIVVFTTACSSENSQNEPSGTSQQPPTTQQSTTTTQQGGFGDSAGMGGSLEVSPGDYGTDFYLNQGLDPQCAVGVEGLVVDVSRVLNNANNDLSLDSAYLYFDTLLAASELADSFCESTDPNVKASALIVGTERLSGELTDLKALVTRAVTDQACLSYKQRGATLSPEASSACDRVSGSLQEIEALAR